MSFIQLCCERGPKSHMAKEISERGRRRSREKGNQGVGDFRFINILQRFSFLFFFFFSITALLCHFLNTFFYPRHLPTPMTSILGSGSLVSGQPLGGLTVSLEKPVPLLA